MAGEAIDKVNTKPIRVGEYVRQPLKDSPPSTPKNI
jgi:hypothetical protein